MCLKEYSAAGRLSSATAWNKKRTYVKNNEARSLSTSVCADISCCYIYAREEEEEELAASGGCSQLSFLWGLLSRVAAAQVQLAAAAPSLCCRGARNSPHVSRCDCSYYCNPGGRSTTSRCDVPFPFVSDPDF